MISRRRAINVLLVEDDPDDYVIALDMLEQGGAAVRLDWVQDPKRAIDMMATNTHDVYLMDYNLGATTGLEIWQTAQRRGCNGAVVFLTGTGSRDVDLAAMDNGAYDFLVKGEVLPEALERSLRYAARLRRQNAELLALALSDPVTGLANKRAIDAHLSRAVDRAARAKQLLAVMFVDLDGFKPINDLLGHRAGDTVLRVVAKRVEHAVRSIDLVGRLGGDEFAVIVEGLHDRNDAAKIAEKIVGAICKPIGVATQVVRVGASIGIALCPDHGLCVEQLLQMADSAMYDRKQGGGMGHSFYLPSMKDPRPAVGVDLPE
ncbi:MAG: diguanylate cyclase [Deltaproteobacteria bacterium]|nr:diguanylate cyclase [Deltaproteobacteria bacterium]